jgi:hypothetical protein
MSLTSKLFRIVFGFWVSLLLATLGDATTTSFTIKVPKRTNQNATVTTDVDKYPIIKMKVTVQVDTDNPVTFTVNDPWGGSPLSLGTFKAGDPQSSMIFFPLAPGATVPASVRVYPPPSGLAPTHPDFRKYVFLFNLDADFKLGAQCTGVMSGDETWTVNISGGNFTKVCVQSLNSQISGLTSCPSTPLGPVPITGPVASVGGLPNSMLSCRPGLDCVLVLDHSGSMSSQDLNPAGSQQKIAALRTSVKTLVEAWDTVRTNEAAGTPPINSPNDQIGVVLFDSNANWWNLAGLNPSGLNSYPAESSNIHDHTDSITPNTNTAIGKGLQLADPIFTNNGNRHIILLMTDGIQNTDPYVAVNDAGNPTQILTYNRATPNATTPLPNQSNYQVYVTSIGTSVAVDPAVIQPLATAGRGFYANAETDSAKLNTFFTEGLQNFLQFSTQQTVRIIGDNITPGTPYIPAQGFPFSTTSQSAVFVLTWNTQRAAVLRLTITPPGGGRPFVKTSQDGTLVMGIPLPPPPPYDPKGNWNIQIDSFNAAGVASVAVTNPQPIPFNFVVLADDLGLNSTLRVVPADYAPTDKIKLQVELKELGQPVKNVGTVVAQLVKPGVSIGDLLSQSTASSNPSNPGDTNSAAQNKLDNTLQANPSLLKTLSDTVILYDDGKSEHGDAVAGDGIYSALYPSQLPGHYNFLFLAEGKSASVSNFSRMQFQSVYVRSLPDANNTALSNTVSTSASGKTLTITMIPKTKVGDSMGPGWANYFWFTAPGQTPFKPKDNLDGTYTATLNFTGATPAVALHFLRTSFLIDDSVAPGNLPVPLGAGNTVIPNVLRHKNCFERLFSTMFFPLLGGLFLIGLAVYLPLFRSKS